MGVTTEFKFSTTQSIIAIILVYDIHQDVRFSRKFFISFKLLGLTVMGEAPRREATVNGWLLNVPYSTDS